jgi:putative ABC transport system ATP-binding protein
MVAPLPVEIADLSFAYPGGFRLQVPRLEVAPGERVAVVGPSGSGKTTLLNLIAGLARPDRGRVRVAGTEVGALSEGARRSFRGRTIGFVFQDFALLDYLSARENILYPSRIVAGLRPDAAARARTEELAAACGLAGKLDRRPGALSRGEQQRVAVCRALVTGPRLVLADEATGNLDPATKGTVLDLLFDRAAEAGAAVLAVTHDHELLPRFDRVVDFAAFRGEGA